MEQSISGITVIATERGLARIKAFVYRVLRHSCTTCSALQSAFCYIEAVGQKVPEAVKSQKQGVGVRSELGRGQLLER
jgi:hypothetical protein